MKRILIAVVWIIATLAVAAVVAVFCWFATLMVGLSTNSCDAMCYQLWLGGAAIGFLADLAVFWGSASLWKRRHHPRPPAMIGTDVPGSDKDVQQVDHPDE